VHDEGDWQFLCGTESHGADDCHLVGVGHLVDRDETLHECADIADGWKAERSSVGAPWQKGPLE
jgi:hypothetical protein